MELDVFRPQPYAPRLHPGCAPMPPGCTQATTPGCTQATTLCPQAAPLCPQMSSTACLPSACAAPARLRRGRSPPHCARGSRMLTRSRDAGPYTTAWAHTHPRSLASQPSLMEAASSGASVVRERTAMHQPCTTRYTTLYTTHRTTPWIAPCNTPRDATPVAGCCGCGMRRGASGCGSDGGATAWSKRPGSQQPVGASPPPQKPARCAVLLRGCRWASAGLPSCLPALRV